MLPVRILTVFAAAVALAAGAVDSVPDGWRPYGTCGIRKDFVYDAPSREPIHFGGWSRSENAYSGEYCVYLDVFYADGTNDWGVQAPFSPGTHGWECAERMFVPKRDVRKVECFAFLRNGVGKAWFDRVFVKRGDPGIVIEYRRRKTERPYLATDVLAIGTSRSVRWTSRDDVGTVAEGTGRELRVPFAANARTVSLEMKDGQTVRRETFDIPASALPKCPLAPDARAVWTADSMRRITALTFPSAGDLPARPLDLLVARRGQVSAQVNVSSGAAAPAALASLRISPLTAADGCRFRGKVKWERVGYIRRQIDASSHPDAPHPEETWIADPLLDAGPMRLRSGGTQGAWVTVEAAADERPGDYAAAIDVVVGDAVAAKVPLRVKVCGFSQPETFGMQASFSLMDGFTRRHFPDDPRKAIVRAQDIMLDHRLTPDDISRTVPPDPDDVARWRARGMNRFNVLNLVPPPKDPNAKWVCCADPGAVFNESFFTYVTNTLTPYMAELKRRGLDKYAYIYGFDEREKGFYEGIEKLWHRLKAVYPDLPLMTTAMMYRDMAAAKDGKVPPHTEITDWHCPLTDRWSPAVSERLRKLGMQCWWYVCCGPHHPYANLSNTEYPPIEGRLLAWMTYQARSDGLLFWHVNFWSDGERIAEDDTFSPDWRMRSGLKMHGDGIFLYPGKADIHPSVRLAQVRDGIQDYEWLQLAEKSAGRMMADAACARLIRSLTDYTRDPADLLAERAALAQLIEPGAKNGAAPIPHGKIVVVNEDNDHYFKLDPKLMTEEALKTYIDGLAGGKVTHFFMCPSGQRPSYDSKVWEPIWTGLAEPGGLNQGEATRWAQNAKLLRDKGIDPYQVWIRRCRERGISPWLTPRMNDAHNSDQKNPFRSTTFWRTRDDLHCQPGYRGRDWPKCTFDFSHDEVQDYTFALVKEQLDRYDIDGYELDFFRFSEYFPAGKAEKSSSHLDRFVKRVRAYVDLKAKERGHPILLGVRVATTPKAARAKGCDVGTWVKEGWVDWVTGSTYWETPDYNMPVAEWRAWFGDKADKVKLLAGTDHGVNATPHGGFRVDMEPGFYAGYADVQWGNGVDGVYLFNVPYLPKALAEICREGLFPDDLPSLVRRCPVSFRSEAWGGVPNDIQLPKPSDRDNEFRIRLGASPSGAVSVLVGVKESGDFAPVVTLNGIAATASRPETLHVNRTTWPIVSFDYHCRRYDFPSAAVHAGADNVVKVAKTDVRKTIIWCEIDLKPKEKANEQ